MYVGRELTDIEPLYEYDEWTRDRWFVTRDSRQRSRGRYEKKRGWIEQATCTTFETSRIRVRGCSKPSHSPIISMDHFQRLLFTFRFSFQDDRCYTHNLPISWLTLSSIYRNSRGYCEFWFIHPREKYRGLILIIGNTVYKSHLLGDSPRIYIYIHFVPAKKKINYSGRLLNNPFPSKN